METAGFAAYQGKADLNGGGGVTATRTFLRFGGLYQLESGTGFGLSLGVGNESYDFESGAARLWGDIRTIRLSVPIRFQFGQSARAIVAPQIRRNFETGAGGSDSETYGVFAGVSWQFGNSLRVGPAFGAFSELGDSGIDAFPAVILDWQISDRWALSTGSALAASRGPGLQLTYAYNDALKIGLGVRSERSTFRLDSTGVAPGGIGEDRNIPVVLSLDYNPNPGLSVSGFVGAAFDGTLSVEDAGGATISRQSYESAPIAGLAIRLRF
jgi:hypothetical protein